MTQITQSSEEPIPARPAATVIVLRDGDPFECLLLRRNDQVAFMAGAYVFPGGRVDPGDHPAPGAMLLPATFLDLSESEEAAYRQAAVRELMEEANVTIGPADLAPLAHWVTPEIETRRYDTRFFLTNRHNTIGELGKGDGEFADLRWFTLSDARELDLPVITRIILGDVEGHLANPESGTRAAVPFYYEQDGLFRRDLIPRVAG